MNRIAMRLPRPPLALLNVLHGGRRTLVTVAGMALAVVMVLLDLGLLEAVRITARINYDHLDFDVALVSAQFEQFYYPGEYRRRLLGSVAGAAFAVVLMLVEDGCRNALLDNMVAIIRRIDGDLSLIHRERSIISEPVRFPRGHLELARGAPGVAEAHPFYLVTENDSLWRNPMTGPLRLIRLLGFDPGNDLLPIEDIRRQRPAWERPDTALADD